MQGARNSFVLAGAALLAVAVMPSIATAQSYADIKSNGPLHLRGQGSFMIQGDAVPVSGVQSGKNPPTPGNRVINQMAVQFMLPQAQNGKKHAPIVFVHGGGLTSKSWQTTPDGRMGWDEYFVREGWDVFLADQVSRGRSGFDGRTYQDVLGGVLPPTSQANIILTTDTSSWPAYRFGACAVAPCYATGTPYPGNRFPLATLGVGNNGANLQFFNQSVPDLNATLGTKPASASGIYAGSPRQMAKLAKELDGAILVGHSESSDFPTRAALQPESGCYPWTTAKACKVKGIIQLETGCFGNLSAAEINTLKHIPILIMFADFSPVQQPAAPCPTEIQQITAAGGDIKFAWLPQLVANDLYPGSPGPITGNSHMVMFDNNNLKIADILIGWATARGL